MIKLMLMLDLNIDLLKKDYAYYQALIFLKSNLNTTLFYKIKYLFNYQIIKKR